MTLARFHRSLNKVYIPLDEEEELEVVRTVGSRVGLLGVVGGQASGHRQEDGISEPGSGIYS